MNVATVIAVVFGFFLALIVLAAVGVALFFLIRLIRDLTVALKAISAALEVLVGDAKAVETAKALRALAASTPEFIRHMQQLHSIIANFVSYSMQAPGAAAVLGADAAAGSPGGGKAYAFSEEAAADREAEANLARLGINVKDSLAPDVGEVQGIGG